jgi:hypothetical protein
MIKRTFIDLFESKSPSLKVKMVADSDEEPVNINIKNKINRAVDAKGLARLEEACTDPRLRSFVEFYAKYNGFSLGILRKNLFSTKPLLEQLKVSHLPKFTSMYLTGGRKAWEMDFNSRNLYRGGPKWIAFADVNRGQACLTIYLDGENAGSVSLLWPSNIIKPIAKSYEDLLDLIATDPAAFFKLIKAYVLVTGKDKLTSGHIPVEYVDGK